VREGLGLAFLSQRAVAEDLRAGRLKRVPFPGTPLARDFHLVRLRKQALGEAARALHFILQQNR
jgi:DNA-binding transcriptional LysR family regulator